MPDKVGLLQLFKYSKGFDFVLIFLGTVAAMVNGATLPVMTIFFGDIIQAVVIYDSRIPFAKEALDSAVKDGVIKMCIVGAITFLVSYIQMACWMISGESQAKRIRESYFRSVIRQEVAWFDKTSTGDLTNR
jgi:ATP-binding cassette subfamily B (MDR/TAP) protein 1